ncbi:ABC transporter permease [Amycolatopsis acidicola]|uniref:ABC transporter permease n=1 Tax=Amycolatopsis acidicola TaxID=2596893 RepID=A0A5N0V4P1_9PSEU|nr:ABC transporter permease [Amycolatopsis acidicola]KAA9160053.1 ABC transporter permease [Amycolatopsis acidicola]
MNRRTLDVRATAAETVPAAQVPETVAEENASRQGKPGRRAWIVRIISFVVVLGAWEILGRQVNPLFMSYPSEIAQAAVTLTQSGELPQALLESLRTLVLGFLAGSVVGIVTGLVVGRYRTAEWATDWLINALYATPLVAVVPLVILWFGLGFEAKLFIVFILTIFPVIINVAAGVRNIDRRHLDVGAAFAASERQIFQKIVLPSALPYIMVGLRLGIGRAIIGMVVAEFFTGITGLGAIITKYGNQFDTAAMLVPVLVLMALGIILTAGVRALERWIAPWKRDDEE